MIDSILDRRYNFMPIKDFSWKYKNVREKGVVFMQGMRVVKIRGGL